MQYFNEVVAQIIDILYKMKILNYLFAVLTDQILFFIAK